MKAFVKYDVLSEDRARVYSLDYRWDSISDEEMESGIVVEYEEAANVPPGKLDVLYVNPLTGESWHEFEDRLLSPEEQIREMQKEVATAKNNEARIADIELALAELLNT